MSSQRIAKYYPRWLQAGRSKSEEFNRSLSWRKARENAEF